MKRIIAAALSILVGAFGYTIVDQAMEDRVTNLESEVVELREEISNYHLQGATGGSTEALPSTTIGVGDYLQKSSDSLNKFLIREYAYGSYRFISPVAYYQNSDEGITTTKKRVTTTKKRVTTTKKQVATTTCVTTAESLSTTITELMDTFVSSQTAYESSDQKETVTTKADDTITKADSTTTTTELIGTLAPGQTAYEGKDQETRITTITIYPEPIKDLFVYLTDSSAQVISIENEDDDSYVPLTYVTVTYKGYTDVSLAGKSINFHPDFSVEDIEQSVQGNIIKPDGSFEYQATYALVNSPASTYKINRVTIK